MLVSFYLKSYEQCGIVLFLAFAYREITAQIWIGLEASLPADLKTHEKGGTQRTLPDHHSQTHI